MSEARCEGGASPAPFRARTFELPGSPPVAPAAAIAEIERAEATLGLRQSGSTRRRYSREDALRILAEHSNEDPPIPVRDFAPVGSSRGGILFSEHVHQFPRDRHGPC